MDISTLLTGLHWAPLGSARYIVYSCQNPWLPESSATSRIRLEPGFHELVQRRSVPIFENGTCTGGFTWHTEGCRWCILGPRLDTQESKKPPVNEVGCTPATDGRYLWMSCDLLAFSRVTFLGISARRQVDWVGCM